MKKVIKVMNKMKLFQIVIINENVPSKFSFNSALVLFIRSSHSLSYSFALFDYKLWYNTKITPNCNHSYIRI